MHVCRIKYIYRVYRVSWLYVYYTSKDYTILVYVQYITLIRVYTDVVRLEVPPRVTHNLHKRDDKMHYCINHNRSTVHIHYDVHAGMYTIYLRQRKNKIVKYSAQYMRQFHLLLLTIIIILIITTSSKI